jgi:predicted transcriptional regulator
MKTASIPSLRVAPELRQAAESVLREGETLSGFVEASIRDQIRIRESQAEFIARGLRSRAQAQQTGEYFEVEEVLQELDAIAAEYDQKRRA